MSRYSCFCLQFKCKHFKLSQMQTEKYIFTEGAVDKIENNQDIFITDNRVVARNNRNIFFQIPEQFFNRRCIGFIYRFKRLCVKCCVSNI